MCPIVLAHQRRHALIARPEPKLVEGPVTVGGGRLGGKGEHFFHKLSKDPQNIVVRIKQFSLYSQEFLSSSCTFS